MVTKTTMDNTTTAKITTMVSGITNQVTGNYTVLAIQYATAFLFTLGCQGQVWNIFIMRIPKHLLHVRITQNTQPLLYFLKSKIPWKCSGWMNVKENCYLYSFYSPKGIDFHGILFYIRTTAWIWFKSYFHIYLRQNLW